MEKKTKKDSQSFCKVILLDPIYVFAAKVEKQNEK